MKYLALLGILLLTVACGGPSDHGGVIDDSSAGRMGTAGHSGSAAGNSGKGGESGSGDAGEGGEAGGNQQSQLAPVVVISAPTALTDPTKGTVLTDDQATVTCAVTRSTDASALAVLTSSVKIQMFGADGKQIGMDGSVMATSNADEYSAHFVLVGNVPSGAVSFSCSASDQSPTPHTGSATVTTYYDGGPKLALTNPANKSAHALGPILFKFSALPAPLVAGDDGAAVQAVTLSVNGVKISKITALTDTPGYYQADIDLSDAMTFAPKPVGTVPVVITATNKRGTTATQNFSFVVDSIGPVITVVTPPISSVQFVGGQTTVTFTVADETGGSGVDASSVQVKVNSTDAVSYMEGNYWHLASDGQTFSYTFNTLDFSSQLGVTVKISAYDLAGNPAAGVAPFYYLDNIPPVVDMQPPLMQERTKSGQDQICSEFFDPLGDSPDDIATITGPIKTVPSVNNFRALIWDYGNVVDGQGIEFYSDVDTKVGVRLYFQQDTTKPLVKNFKGTPGGVCDDIADTTVPFITLAPVAPTGSAYYDKNAPLNGCIAGTATMPPDFLCGGNSALTRVIQHEAAVASTPVPVIYAFQPSDGALCTGGQFDLTTTIQQDGWICAAVVAQDKIGNRAVSAPIRMCLDAADQAGTNYHGTPNCATGANPPTCVAPAPGGCVPPPHFNQTLTEKL